MKDVFAILSLALLVGVAWVMIKVAGAIGGFLIAILGVAWFIWQATKEYKNATRNN